MNESLKFFNAIVGSLLIIGLPIIPIILFYLFKYKDMRAIPDNYIFIGVYWFGVFAMFSWVNLSYIILKW